MITALNHITLAVKDIDRSFDFYKDVLDFIPMVKWEGSAYFFVGHGSAPLWFCLDRDTKRQESIDNTHYAFSVEEKDFDALSEKIKSSGAQIYKENTSPGKSLYFLDPDGHKLEIHVGNWQDRIASKKKDPGKWTNVEWFV
jgi:catechol 2,3-dioxygenase-like lactoylglutathione lyase family enzyme